MACYAGPRWRDMCWGAASVLRISGGISGRSSISSRTPCRTSSLRPHVKQAIGQRAASANG